MCRLRCTFEKQSDKYDNLISYGLTLLRTSADGTDDYDALVSKATRITLLHGEKREKSKRSYGTRIVYGPRRVRRTFLKIYIRKRRV